MCEQLVVLATHTTSCYIAQCEHGTVHLCWDNISVHLRPPDFLSLTHTVADICAKQPDATGKMRLGIGTLTLELLSDDYHPMLALMQRAAAQLQPTPVKRLEPSKPRFLRSAGPCLN